MSNRLTGFILAATLSSAATMFGQCVARPGTAGGCGPAPDISGVWMGRQLIRSFNPKEAPPMQPWAAEQFEAVRDKRDPNEKGLDEKDPLIRCYPPGLPRILTFPRPFEIIQMPGRVLMLFEWDHLVRQIWMDVKEHPKDLDPSWLGHAIGHWDGDTLVVDTVGFNNKTWLDGVGHPHSEALHMVERIRRVDPDTLQDDFTFDDPKAYTKPWTGQYFFKLHPTWKIEEHVVCEDHFPGQRQ